jgi:hypothetical protein
MRTIGFGRERQRAEEAADNDERLHAGNHTVRTPPGILQHTRHQRRFRAYLNGQPIPGGTIAAGSVAWAVDAARRLGADEIRVEREYHNEGGGQ